MSAVPAVNHLLEAALHYAANGLEIFPCNADKSPLVEHGMKDATTDAAQLREWWRKWPNALVACRIPEDRVVIDVDPRHNGGDTWDELQRAYGPIDAGRVHRSGRNDGGRHYWFKRPAGKLTAKNLHEFARNNGTGHAVGKRSWTSGLDLLHHNHRYSILPPSPHPDTGEPYAWEIEGAPQDMPPWFESMLIAAPPPTPPPKLRQVRDDDSIADWYTSNHSWNDVLGSAGWVLVSGDGDSDGSKWRHPNATAESSASIRHDCLFVYSDNTDFDVTEESDPVGYTRFRAWSMLEHDGDLSNAARDARERRDGPSTPIPELPAFNPSDPWPAPSPLSTPAPPPWPTGVLPAWMEIMAVGVADEIQTPLDLPAMLGVGMLAVLSGGRAMVRVKGTWLEPLNLYTVTALPPSIGKSPAVKLMFRPVLDWLDAERARMAPVIEQAKLKRRMIEAEQTKAEKSGDTAGALSLIDELLDAEVPKPPQLWTDDATPEAFVWRMSEHTGRMSILSTEGGVFQLMAGRYSEQMANLDPYLKAWSGDEISVDRIGRESFVIPKPVASIVLTVQPSVLQQVGENTDNRNRGLPARFMMSIPPTNVGNRNMIDAPELDDEVAEEYARHVRAFIERLESIPPGTVLRLSASAKRGFLLWRQQFEARRIGDLEGVAEWLTKMESSVVRLAGLLHLAEGRDAHTEIDDETLTRAIAVGMYWLGHAVIAHDLWDADSALSGARAIVEKMIADEVTVTTARDLMRTHRRRFATIDQLVPALDLLVDKGWLRSEDPTGDVRATKRGEHSPSLTLHPESPTLWKTTPHVAHVPHVPKASFLSSSSSLQEHTETGPPRDMRDMRDNPTQPLTDEELFG